MAEKVSFSSRKKTYIFLAWNNDLKESGVVNKFADGIIKLLLGSQGLVQWGAELSYSYE